MDVSIVIFIVLFSRCEKVVNVVVRFIVCGGMVFCVVIRLVGNCILIVRLSMIIVRVSVSMLCGFNKFSDVIVNGIMYVLFSMRGL